MHARGYFWFAAGLVNTVVVSGLTTGQWQVIALAWAVLVIAVWIDWGSPTHIATTPVLKIDLASTDPDRIYREFLRRIQREKHLGESRTRETG